MKYCEKIIWNKELSIGNMMIDSVHKRLIDIYNEMIEFIQSEHNREDFAIILSKMTDYSLMHFKREEEYMNKMGYPALIDHRNDHKDYIYKVAMYNIDLASSIPPELDEVAAFIEKWWIHHILEIDTLYEKYKVESHSDVKY